MAVDTKSRSAMLLASSEEAQGIVQTMAAGLVALTATDAVMIAINRSSLPMSTRLFAVKYGEILFVVAGICIGFTARSLGQKRFLPILATYATVYTALTQFRGAWIWDGTFDKFMYPRTPWLRDSAIGLVLALLVGVAFRPTRPPRLSASAGWIGALALSVVASVFLPRLWPGDSDFAATRPLVMGGCLVALAAVAVLARMGE